MKNAISFVVSTFLYIVISIVLFGVGIALILYPNIGIVAAQRIFILILFLKSFGEFWAYFIQRDMRTRARLYQGIGFLLLGMLVLINHNFRIVSLTLVLSGVFLLDALLKFAISVQYKRSGLSNWWLTLLMGGISLSMMLFFFFSNHYTFMIQVTGLYICWQVISSTIDRIFRGQNWKDSKKGLLMKFLYIHQNTYKNSFLPARWFEKVEEDIHDKNDPDRFLEKSNIVRTVPMDGYTTMKVTIHSWDGDTLTMKGHSDFIVDDKCYSFGNYDVKSHYFDGSLSDGVVVVSDEAPYIEYCLEKEHKVLIQYTLRISNEQKNKLNQLLNNMKEITRLWYPPVLEDKTAKDDASKLYEVVHPNFYKFKTGQFKYYFVLNTNCIRFIQYVLAYINFDVRAANGVLTPGDYLDFFEKKLENPNDYDVIERQVMVAIKKEVDDLSV